MSGAEHSQVVPIDSARAAISDGVRGFAADMRAQGIHVGMGSTPRCVTCGEKWPCSASNPAAPTDVNVDALVAAAADVAVALRDLVADARVIDLTNRDRLVSVPAHRLLTLAGHLDRALQPDNRRT